MQDRKDNSGFLFNNKDDEKAKSPYGGTASIDGVEYYINAWVNEGKKGKYFKLSFRAKQERLEPRQQAWSQELDDEVPF